MDSIRPLLRLPVLVFLLLNVPAQSQDTILGFTHTGAAKQVVVEQKFKAIPTPDEERRQHRIFTSAPHLAGSERNNELARYIADEWRKQGLEDVVLRRYDVYSTAPKSSFLEMVAPVHYQASLHEHSYDEDPDTKDPAVSLAWMGMSLSGEITAPVVYAHSGNPADYELLRKNGIDVKGKIVLVRYSNPYSYRGFKALTAQKEGAAAILIYSDPAEDGYKKGKVFPEGPWGPENHIQHGAITYDFMVPGDPLTPGWASVPGAKRITVDQAVSLPKIMALPLSWHDAKPLLDNMGGPVAPDDWQGGLPFQYHLGGEARVHLKIEVDNSTKPYYVVEGRIRGSELPDEWVVLGNHRDAWVFGGVDPSSGTASMMEMTRALGQLAKQGIRPRRTLVVCSWDGEEIGLTGSTEWGEQFADELRKKAVAYLNVDSSTSGPNLDGSAVASLVPMLVETSHSVQDPSGKSLYDAWKVSETRKRQEAKKTDEVTDANLPSAVNKQQTISVGAPPHFVTMCDADRIREAIDNLVSNAIKYSPIGGKIAVGVTHEGSNTVVRITDEGAGLSPEDLGRLFGRFQRLSAKPTAGESSTGLGLSIVKRIIDMHGGHVTADSAGPGQGSTFTVTLPATEKS